MKPWVKALLIFLGSIVAVPLALLGRRGWGREKPIEAVFTPPPTPAEALTIEGLQPPEVKPEWEAKMQAYEDRKHWLETPPWITETIEVNGKPLTLEFWQLPFVSTGIWDEAAATLQDGRRFDLDVLYVLQVNAMREVLLFPLVMGISHQGEYLAWTVLFPFEGTREDFLKQARQDYPKGQVFMAFAEKPLATVQGIDWVSCDAGKAEIPQWACDFGQAVEKQWPGYTTLVLRRILSKASLPEGFFSVRSDAAIYRGDLGGDAMKRVRSFPDRYPWFWRNAPYAIMMGIVLAFVILAAIPQSACWAGCSQRDKWCNGGHCDSLTCKPGTRGRIVKACHWSPVNGVCADTMQDVILPCRGSDNCNVTEVIPDEYLGRLYKHAGRAWLRVGACNRDLVGEDCDSSSPILDVNIDKVDCCSGGGGGGGGGGAPTCKYDPPEILLDTTTISPPFPLTIGQDPNEVGVTVSLDARGGKKTNNCNGPDRANIKEFQVVGISLAQSSRDWITQELAAWYLGAYVKGSYPMAPDWAQALNLNKKRATLTFHFSPLDPGYYIVTVKAVQDRGSDKDTTAQLRVPVYLLETSIVR